MNRALNHREHALRAQEREAAEQIIAEVLSTNRMTDEELLLWAQRARMGFDDEAKWFRKPVGIREFIESPIFLDDQTTWPLLMEDLEEINSGRYTECVFTGPIGAGKTSGAVNTLMYQLYVLSCMRDPHYELDQNPKHEIVMIVQAITKDSAKEVGYTRMRNAIAASPYFQNYFMFDENLESQMRFPRNIVIKPVAGHETAAIGQNVIGGLLDEVNFMKVVKDSKKSRDGEIFDQAKKNYNTIARRRTSRFMNKGWVPGMLCLVSSRNYPGQFTDEKEAEAVTNSRIFIYDRKTWELTPEKFNPGRFNLFIGDEARKPRVLKDGEKWSPGDDKLVMQIPTDLKDEFEKKDIYGALRDIAGVATSSNHVFIMDKEKLSAAFSKKHESILSRDTCDFKQTKLQLYPLRKRHLEFDRWIHYDAGITGDHGGLAMGYVSHFVNVKRGMEYETLPHIVFDFLLDIVPPLNGEIEFENVRKLMYSVREMGWPLKFVSMDTFQSRDSLQILWSNKFKAGIRSMDTETTPYDVLKQAIYDGRITFPESEKAHIELSRLELDVKKKKIDHPPNGSKDVADAIAGVVMGLTSQREIWRQHSISTLATPKSVAKIVESVNKEKNSVNSRERRFAQTQG